MEYIQIIGIIIIFVYFVVSCIFTNVSTSLNNPLMWFSFVWFLLILYSEY